MQHPAGLCGTPPGWQGKQGLAAKRTRFPARINKRGSTSPKQSPELIQQLINIVNTKLIVEVTPHCLAACRGQVPAPFWSRTGSSCCLHQHLPARVGLRMPQRGAEVGLCKGKRSWQGLYRQKLPHTSSSGQGRGWAQSPRANIPQCPHQPDLSTRGKHTSVTSLRCDV